MQKHGVFIPELFQLNNNEYVLHTLHYWSVGFTTIFSILSHNSLNIDVNEWGACQGLMRCTGENANTEGAQGGVVVSGMYLLQSLFSPMCKHMST
jgi:hypothetical protein